MPFAIHLGFELGKLLIDLRPRTDRVRPVEADPGGSALHRLPPQAKVAAAVLFVIAVVATPSAVVWAFGVHAGVIMALALLAGIPLSTLVRRLTIEVPFPGPPDLPLISFRGLVNGTEGRTWWMPSRTCVEHMLKRMGFTTVSVAGRYSGIVRQAWFPYWREVIRGTP